MNKGTKIFGEGWDTEGPAGTAASEERAPHARLLSILHLEDDPLDVELTHETLLAGGLRASLCRVDTREAYLEELHSCQHDLILADYSLPAFDGRTALRLAQEHCPETPFILLSGALGEELAVEVLREGATDYVLKHRPEKLLPAVRRALREVDDREERRRAEEALRFLSDASRTLAESLDWDATLRNITLLAVPRLADWCQLDLLDEDGTSRRLVAARAVPSPEGIPLPSRLRPSLNPSIPAGRTFQAELLERGAPEAASYPASVEELQAQGYGCQLCMPLTARGRTLGGLTFAWQSAECPEPGTDTKLLEELARRAALALDNARLYRISQEADRRKEDFLAMLAHELRNPLAPIRNMLHAVRVRGLEKPLDEARYELLNRQVQHLNSLVDDLLDVSRITRGKIEVRPHRMELIPAVRGAVQTSRPLFEARRHQLVIRLPEEPVWIDADPTRLEQVLCNLLNNAAKYTEPGGRVELTVEVDEPGTSVTLRVRDTGIGISREMLARIFEPFAQAEVSIHRTLGGLGLGLTLVRTLVELHGGTVEVHSDGPNQGSEFLVRLPVAAPPSSGARVSGKRLKALPSFDGADGLDGQGGGRGRDGVAVAVLPASHRDGDGGQRHAGLSLDLDALWPEEADPEPPLSPAEPSAGLGRRILVIEDNPDGRETLRDLLELWGHTVETAADGPSGVARALSHWPEIALVDIGLPGADGYQVARELRRAGEDRPPITLIALTGYGQPDDRRRALEAGFNAHLVKPLDPERLEPLLQG